jgi:hypothetical protein
VYAQFLKDRREERKTEVQQMVENKKNPKKPVKNTVCVCVCVCACACVCVCVCVCVCACACVCVHTRTHAHTHMYVCIRVCGATPRLLWRQRRMLKYAHECCRLHADVC